MTEPPTSLRAALLQCDSSQSYRTIAHVAMQFAVLGYSDVAMRLIFKMNAHNYFHGRDMTLQPLHLLWNMLGSWPDHEEERAREDIARLRRRQATRSQDAPVTMADVQAKLEDLAKSWAQGWWSPDQEFLGVGWEALQLQKQKEQTALSKPPAYRIKEILAAIDQMHPEEYRDSLKGMKTSSGLVKALDLRLQIEDQEHEAEDQEDLPSVDKLLSMIAKRLNTDWKVAKLSQSRRIWKILSQGALARVMGIDTEKVEAFAKVFEETVDERFEKGRSDYSEMSIKDVLKQIEANSRANAEADNEEWYRNLGEDETPFRDPATSQEIDETEERLGISLPDDYKDFVMTTNGFGSGFEGFIIEPPLHPLSDLRRFRDDEDYFTELSLTCFPSDEFVSAVYAWDPCFDFDEPKVGKEAVEIGTGDPDNVWLISPSKMNEVKDLVRKVLKNDTCNERVKISIRRMIEGFAGSEEKFWNLGWGCVTWAAGGYACMTAYPSFKAYLQSVMHDGMKDKDDLLSEGNLFGYAMSK